jgi:hypothetical protein
LGELTAFFLRWFEQQDPQQDLWPAYDRWIRDTLNQFLGARRVRCFKFDPSAGQLTSLTTDMDDAVWSGQPPHDLIRHVVTSGRPYIRGASGNGNLIEQLASQWTDSTASSATWGPTGWFP